MAGVTWGRWVGHMGCGFLSRAMSNRSGNRGECSQPCRLSYDLVDKSGRTIRTSKHLLAGRDLSLGKRLGEMIDAGVRSFKIEGRLKDRAYVRNTVSHYRKLLDQEISLREGITRSSFGESRVEFIPDPAKSFTRGGSEYLFDGGVRGVATFETPKSVGEFIGSVRGVTTRGFTLDRESDLHSGDGVCFVTQNGVIGTYINGVENYTITPNKMDGIEVGVKIYRNYNHIFNRALERSPIRRSIDVDLQISATQNQITTHF